MVTRIFDEPSKSPLPNEPNFDDHRFSVIKGTIATIPVIGGLLVEELGLILAPTLNRRRDEWFNDLARRLREIESNIEGFEIKALTENESFVSAVLQATQSAIKTHAPEKLEALRNAVLNIAVGAAPSHDMQAMFLRLVDTLTPSHLRLLRFLQQPGEYIQGSLPGKRIFVDDTTLYNPTFYQLVGTGLPNAFPSAEFVRCLMRDLNAAGLQTLETSDVGIPPASRFTTSFGDEFLRFIEAPPASVIDR